MICFKGAVMAEDPMVIFAVFGAWGLGLLGLYGLASLAVWLWEGLRHG